MKITFLVSSYLVWIFFLTICACEKCSLVLNELNVEDPQKIGKLDFLEVKSLCDGEQKSISLQG